MPPKKGPRQQVSESIRIRREFQKKRRANPVIIQTHHLLDFEDSNCPEDFLYLSQYDAPVYKEKPTKKKALKKKKKCASPHVSDDEIRISSDEEGAGQCHLPERTTEDDEKLRAMQRMQDSLDDVSLVVLNHNNVRLKVDENGMLAGIHEKQLEERWKPAVHEELPGNFSPPNKSRKNHKKKEKKVKELAPVGAPTPQKASDWRQTIRNDRERDEQRRALRNAEISRCIRIFGTPASTTLSRMNATRNDRFSIVPTTPIRIISMDAHRDSNRFSMISHFSPIGASTPIDKLTKGKIIETRPVFDLSDDMEIADDYCQRRLTETAKIQLDTAVDFTTSKRESEKTAVEKSITLKEPTFNEKSEIVGGEGDNRDASRKSNHPADEPKVYEDVDNETIPPTTETLGLAVDDTVVIPETTISRKAETSLTDVLADSIEEEVVPDDSTHTKKRQRTKSPETMCQETSTMMISVQESEQKENEGGEGRRGTLQPQMKQLLRESRLSTMTTASSRRDSINSLMEDMSISLTEIDDDLALMKTHASENTTRMESRAGTAMTIRNDNPDAPMFYLADMSLSVPPTELNKLLHVAGQSEPKAWTSVPKGAFDGRTVKKLGEGSYGEVFSTKWDGIPVAIKIVPFEESEELRKYDGPYHSEKMQVACDIIPELLIMKELSGLKDLTLENSTPNFINLMSSQVVKGSYPKGLLKAWDTYDDMKNSENTRPSEYAGKEQLFILFVTENGGVALESFRLKNEEELRSVILQLALSLVAAENALSFEHRDLHLGNVLIDRNGVETLSYKIKDHDIKIAAKGVKVNIIDFTLSYMYKDTAAVYSDLAQDPELFTGEGDPQFDVYRQMRDNCGNVWGEHHKKSNLLWLVFLAKQMIDNPDICPPDLTEKRRKELHELFNQLGEYDSCNDSFLDGTFYNRLYLDYML